jgi:hypothetical protein
MASTFANISLYIPHVFANISKNKIVETFEKLRIGSINRIDFLSKKSKKSNYNAAYIHFSEWYDNIASRNFQQRVLDPNMEARIVYDEPWFWIVLENKTKRSGPNMRKPCVNLEALNKSQIMTPPAKQMNNNDFAKLISAPETQEDFFFDAQFKSLCSKISTDICLAQEDAGFITLDDVIDENKKLREQLGEYMEKTGRLEHQFNMLMDEKISRQNHNALLQEEVEKVTLDWKRAHTQIV